MYIPKSVRTKLATEKLPLGWKNKELKKCPLRGCFGKVPEYDLKCSECKTQFKGTYVKILMVKK